MIPGGGDWNSSGGYQPINDLIAHIDVPAETAGDRIWSQDISGLWGNLTKELAKACYTGNEWRVKYLLDLKHKEGKSIDINKVVKHEGLNQVALSYAVSKKNYIIIDLLMCSGAVFLRLNEMVRQRLTGRRRKRMSKYGRFCLKIKKR